LPGAVSLKSPEWPQIKSILVEKQSPHVLFLKYSCNTTSYIPYINKIYETALDQMFLVPINNQSTVTKAKKDDLLYMCNELIITRDYHFFYQGLHVQNSADFDGDKNSTSGQYDCQT